LTDLEGANYHPQSVTLKVKSYGVIREIIGKDQITLRLPREDGGESAATTTTTTVADLRRRIIELYPAISAKGIVMTIAINYKTAKDSLAINDSDEIALLPPISGGGGC
jgi:molybdopterin converting factor small subunit